MSHHPPHGGPPPYYGYPPPAGVPNGFTYVPTPVMMPMPVYPQDQPTYVTNHIYPPQPLPEPVQVVENADPPPEIQMIDWVPATPATANSLYGKAYDAGKEGWDGSPLWAIRAHHSGNLVPGKLAIKHRASYIPFAGKEVPVHNFEVLCAPNHAVHWVSCSQGQVPPNAIVAGNTHTAEPLYIGRVKHRGSISPGKIHPSHGCCYISFSGSEVSYKQYEVLCRAAGW